jgi:superfamily II DNA or RNA helicase
MEFLQLVRARGARWRVVDVRAFDACRLVTLTSADAPTCGFRRRLLAPFDDIDRIVTASRARRVGIRLWRRACRALIASDAPPGSLRCAAAAQIDLMPQQLEPALAIVRGHGLRVLLADDVGLGKTIQAGLVIAELLARRAIDRALILTPANLRDQWAEELSSRFGFDVAQADARTLRGRAASLPLGQNPWSLGTIVIASLDYAKRGEVFPAVASCLWDAVIVDEAHTAVGDSDRCAAVRQIASRAAYVLLLTATPHSGDARAFETLCGIGGDEDPPLMVFRRTRATVLGTATRRVHTLFIKPSPHERRLFHALASYERAVVAERGRALAASVLQKRALSSAWSLSESVGRRLAALERASPAEDARQMTLPLADPGDTDDEDAPPEWPQELSLADSRKETRLLKQLAAAAHAASAADSKQHAVVRLLRRTRESVIVFTEYRDTALHLASRLGTSLVLHGGLGRAARQSVLETFHRHDRAVLVATDAGGQGLNLHRTCRLVVNLELPWNPMRLEQRIGRVDRIGQRRRVHAFHLIAAETDEERILGRLQRRIASAGDTIDVPNPLDNLIAGHAVARGVSRSYESEAAAEAARLANVRKWMDDDNHRVLGALESSKWWMTYARRSSTRRALAGRTLLVFRLSASNAAGDVVATRVLSLLAGRDCEGGGREAAGRIAREWRASADRADERFWAARIARAKSIADGLGTATDALFQPALFDRRAERLHDAHAADLERLRRAAYDRIVDASRRSSAGAHECELLLALEP